MFTSGKCFSLINPNLLVYPINLLLWIGQESSGVSTVHLRAVELERNGQFVAEENLRSSSAGSAVLGHVVGTDVDCGGGCTCGSSLSQRPRHWRCRSSPRKQCFAGIFHTMRKCTGKQSKPVDRGSCNHSLSRTGLAWRFWRGMTN